MNLIAAILLGAGASGSISPMELKCEYRKAPLGIDELAPRLSWRLNSSRRNQAQSAYQIVAAESEAALNSGRGLLWDTGKVMSDQSQQVVYSGKPLHSREQVWWKVRVWDRSGGSSSYSAPTKWEMGLLENSDWKSEWIGGQGSSEKLSPSPYLRNHFTLGKKIVSARLYVAGLGVYTGYVNGKRVGNDYFSPGWTDYRKRIQYQTYDVTKSLHSGENVLGFVIGDGWYCGNVGFGGRRNYYGKKPYLRAQLHVEYEGGTSLDESTSSNWMTTTGPIETSDLLMGETYDARKELTGWQTPQYDSSKWSSVATIDSAHRPNSAIMVAQSSPAIQKVAQLKPIGLTQNKDVTIYDLGQNMVGWVKLKIKGPAGTKIKLQFAEILNKDGSIYTKNLRAARATDIYTLKGTGVEIYEPSFTFHGFRYVAVTGIPGKPSKDMLTGIVLHSASQETGSFVCSNPLVNQLQHNIQWGQRGNYFDVPTDCPQRDERLGWMGDAQIFVRTGCFNEDISGFMTKWIQDVMDAQSTEGGFSDVSPRLVDDADGAPAWGDAGVIVPWTIYQCYNDTRILEKHYASMAKWIDYIHSANPDLLWRKRGNNNFGDWLNIGADTPRDVLGTAYFAYDSHLMSRMAQALGKTEDAKKYSELFEGIKAAFNKEFVGKDGRIRGNSQTCYVLALRFGLLSEENRTLAAKFLTEDIKARKNHLSTGFVGVGYLTPTLTQTGNLDVAYELLNQDTFPSWLYCIKLGATTIWERWDGYTEEKGFQDPGMNSFNHYSLGSVGEWLYTDVGGIDLDPSKPGYKNILMAPKPGGGLTFAKTDFLSPYGKIKSHWKRTENGFEYDVSIPANTTATITLPASSKDSVTESGMPLDQSEGLSGFEANDGSITLHAGSGTYHFLSR